MTYDERIQYNAMRNATFFLLAATIDELANTKGGEREEFLQEMHAKALEKLDQGRKRDLSWDLDPMTAQIAASTRAIVDAVFDAIRTR